MDDDFFFVKIPITSVGGVYEIPVTLNGILTIPLIIDSGASVTSITPDIALTLIKAGSVAREDWLTSADYILADGTKREGQRFMLNSIMLGRYELNSVECRVDKSLRAPLLLGQSALERLGKYSIDYQKKLFIFRDEYRSEAASDIAFYLATHERLSEKQIASELINRIKQEEELKRGL